MKRWITAMLAMLVLLCAGLNATSDSAALAEEAPVLPAEETGEQEAEKISLDGPVNAWAFADQVEYIGGRIDPGAVRTFRAFGDQFNEVYFELVEKPYLTVGEAAMWRVTVKPTYFVMFAALYWQDFSDTSNMYSYVPDSMRQMGTLDRFYTASITKPGRYMLVIEILEDEYADSQSIVFQSGIFETASEEELLAQKVKSVVSECTNSGMSAYEKALNLHDWLCQNAAYDYTYSEYDASGVLLRGKGVCESFARAYQMLLAEAGIRSTYVTGTSNGQPHIWNLVLLDGIWCHVDVTWDEDSSDKYYFGMSEALISRDHVISNRVPEATSEAYNYALNRADAIFDSLDDLEEMIMELPGDQESFMFYYTGSEQLGNACMEWCEANAERLGLRTWSYRGGSTCLHYIKGTRDTSQAIEITGSSTSVLADGTAQATFTVKTGTDAAALGMYQTNGALIKKYTAEYEDSGEERIWTVSYSFTNDGLRTFVFSALDADGQTVDSEEYLIRLNGSKVHSAAFEKAIRIGEAATAVVKTNLGAKKLYMYGENGKAVASWDAETYSRVDGNNRIWTIEYAFTGKGNRTMTFRASIDGAKIYTGKNAAVTVLAPPAALEAYIEQTVGYKNDQIVVYVKLEDGAKYFHVYDKDGRQLQMDGTHNNSNGYVYFYHQFTGTGVVELTIKGSVDGVHTGTGVKASILITSGVPGVGYAAFDDAYVGLREEAAITVRTNADATQLKMYAENGKAAKTWTASDANSTVVLGERIWKVKHAFTGSGKRTLTFKATKDGTTMGYAQKASIVVGGDYAIKEAGFDSRVVYTKQKTGISVRSGSAAKYLYMYSEGGALVKTWKADGNSTVSGSVRTWNVDYSFASSGNRKITFKTSENGSVFSAGVKDSILVVSGAPAAAAAEFAKKELYKGESGTVTVVTNADASQVKMYSEGGALVKTWKASAANSKVNGTERIWTLNYAFAGAGSRKVTFKATKDGSTMGSGVSVSIKVISDYAMREAEFTSTVAYVKEKVSIRATSGRTAAYLHLCGEGGKIAKTWSAETYSSVVDGVRVWNVEYTFSGGGNRKMQIKASEDGKTVSAGSAASILISNGSPAVSYVKFASGTAAKGESVSITVKTNADAKQVIMCAENGGVAKRWSVDSASTSVNGTERIWKLSYAFGSTGNRKLTFKASKDGSTSGSVMIAGITVK